MTFDETYKQHYMPEASTFEAFYLALLNMLQSNKAAFGDSNLRTIDINYGQTEDPDAFEIFYPALFVSWALNPPRDGGGDILNLELQVMQEPGGNTDGVVASKGLEYLRVIETIKFLTTGFKPDGFAALEADGENSVPAGYVRFHNLRYTCRALPQQTGHHFDEAGEGEVTSFQVSRK